jgi:Xaa-Pro aminopeptidase
MVYERSVNSAQVLDRVARLQERMHQAGLDWIMAFSRTRGHIRFLSGYFPGFLTNWAYLAVPQGGTPTLFIRWGFDAERARAMTPFPVQAEGEMGELDGKAMRVGVVARDLGVDEGSQGVWERISHAFPTATLSDASELVLDLRREKSALDVAGLKHSTQVALAVAAAMAGTLRPGTTDWEVVARGEAAAKQAGAERSVILVSLSTHAVVTEPCGMVLQPSEPVQIEITLCVDGYWVQLNRTFGGRRLQAICEQALETGRRLAEPGRDVAEIVSAMRRVVDRLAPVGTRCEYDFGHGVGWDSPEWPQLTLEATSSRLLPQLVVVLHVGLRLPGEDAAFVGGPLLVQSGGGIWLDR